MRKTILLFDMDGVLVEPRRYRASLQSTMDYFGRIMGWDSLYPGESTIAWFESRGIISEWDIAPVYIAGVIEAVLEANTYMTIPNDLLTFCEMVKRARISKPEFDVETILGQLPGLKKSGFAYCDMVLYLVESGPARAVFSRLAGTPLLDDILQHSRNVHLNLITRVFQEVFLGENAFENSFHLPAICFDRNTERIVDRPLITSDWNSALKKRWQDGLVDMAIFTARPSAQDYPPGEGRIEFSPEADIIVNQLGWQRIPMIGLGQLQYAADQLGCLSVELMKPSPVHILGAIGMAVTRDLLGSIQAGWNLLNDKPTTFYDSFSELDIHVFEDSPVGVRSADKAVDLLDIQGVSAWLTKWGISTDANKVKELQKLDAQIVSTVNEALARVDL
ncbi:MAG: hypothetical protein GYA15_05630 [Leptolinea sp.]|jgi:hypothetical protein|nr:hypothetical protein [Leptolinea sp.]